MDTKMTDQEDLPLSINRMPAELLTMIAEHLALETADIWKCLLVYPELKNLRLVSRQFAYLPFIMSYMFNGIRLLASPEHVKLAETTSLDRLKPYVKKITFEPTKYSWVMTPQLFEEILFVQPLKEAVDAHNNHVNDTMENAPHDAYIGEDTIGDLGSAEFIKKYMDGKAPFTKQELEDGYAKYMAHAQELRTLFDSSKVDAAWTHAIKQLPNAKHFITSEWDYNGELSTMYKHENHGRNWKVRGCEIFGHHHDRGNHDQAPCQRLQAPVGEAVFNAAISSLASGGSTITQLEIHNIFDNSFKCVNNARIKGLNLTNLETLHFSPNIAEIGKSRKRAAIVNKRRSLCHAALNTLLKRSVNSLKVISVQLDHPHTFPPPHVPAMPALEQFSTNAGLNLTDFANFIASARKLRQLELGIGCSGANGDWRELWRAIRYHPSRMDLNFDQIPCNDCAEITMHHNTGRESESENDPSDTWMNIYYSLEMYLSNKGQWNKSCRMWFEDAASDDNRSDSDSVGGEDGGGDDGEWEDE